MRNFSDSVNKLIAWAEDVILQTQPPNKTWDSIEWSKRAEEIDRLTKIENPSEDGIHIQGVRAKAGVSYSSQELVELKEKLNQLNSVLAKEKIRLKGTKSASLANDIANGVTLLKQRLELSSFLRLTQERLELKTDKAIAERIEVRRDIVSDWLACKRDMPEKKVIEQIARRLFVQPSQISSRYSNNDLNLYTEKSLTDLITIIRKLDRVQINYLKLCITESQDIASKGYEHLRSTCSTWTNGLSNHSIKPKSMTKETFEKHAIYNISNLTPPMIDLVTWAEHFVNYCKGGIVFDKETNLYRTKEDADFEHIKYEDVFFLPYRGWDSEWINRAESLKNIHEQGIRSADGINYFTIRRALYSLNGILWCFIHREKQDSDNEPDTAKMIADFSTDLPKLVVKLNICAVFMRYMDGLNKTQAEFAKHMGLDKSHLTHYLNCKKPIPTPKVFINWSEKLRIEPKLIVGNKYAKYSVPQLSCDDINKIINLISYNKLDYVHLRNLKDEMLYILNQGYQGLEPFDKVIDPASTIPV